MIWIERITPSAGIIFSTFEQKKSIPVQSTFSSKASIWAEFHPTIDQHLPQWARRSNPIVRRHLGVHWKVLPLEVDVLVKLLAAQGGLLLLSIPFPVVLPLVFTLLPVALVLLPFVFLAYGRLLISVGAFTVRMMIDEQRNNSLSLLRTTPISLRHILYSKASAGVWRQAEDLGLLVIAAALLSLPAIGLQYAVYWPFEEVNLISRMVMALGLLSSIARLFLEPMMIASMAILVGTLVTQRTQAVVSLIGLGVFYFVLLNLPRLLPLSPELRILVDFILPVVLPVAISAACFQIALAFLRQD